MRVNKQLPNTLFVAQHCVCWHMPCSLSLSLTGLLAAASPDEGADPFISGMKNRPLLPRRSNTHPQQRRDSSAACVCLCQNRKPRPNPSQRRKAIYDMEPLVPGTVRTRTTGGMERRAHPRFVEPLSLQLTCGVRTRSGHPLPHVPRVHAEVHRQAPPRRVNA